MKLFRKVTKFIKTNHILAVLGFLVLLVAITQFSTRKLNVTDNMHGGLSPSPLAPSVVPCGSNTEILDFRLPETHLGQAHLVKTLAGPLPTIERYSLLAGTSTPSPSAPSKE